MPRFYVERVDPEDNQRRESWEFDTGYQHGLRLTMYAIQTRQSNRHKWKGKFWDSSDERSYHSALERPSTIPDDVIIEAREKFVEEMMKVPVYIGWFDEKYAVKETPK